MSMKVKAKEQLQKVGTYAGKYRYVMMPELYTALTQDKVIKEAALRSGVSRGVMQARAKSVESVNDVKANLITSRRIIFTPDTDLKEELAKTDIQITCFDRDGKEVKRVTSTSGEVEDPDNGDGENPENGGGGSSSNSGNGGGPVNP